MQCRVHDQIGKKGIITTKSTKDTKKNQNHFFRYFKKHIKVCLYVCLRALRVLRGENLNLNLNLNKNFYLLSSIVPPIPENP